MRSAADRERGAGTLEHLGVVTIAAVLVVALIAAFVGFRYGDQLAAALCRVSAAFEGDGAASCGSVDGAQDADQEPTDPCVASMSRAEASVGLSVAFVDAGGGAALQVEQMSDGTYQVTTARSGNAGASTGPGELFARLATEDFDVSLGAEANIGAALQGEGGLEYRFASEDEVTDFLLWAAEGVAEDSERVGHWMQGIAQGSNYEVRRWVMDMIFDDGYEPPPPSAAYFEGGLALSTDARGGDIIIGAGGSIDLSGALGHRKDFESGDYTAYQRVELSAEAAASMGLQEVASGAADLEVLMEVTVDEAGTLTGLAVVGAATAEGSYDLGTLAGAPIQASDGKGASIRAHLPVTEQNRARLSDAVNGLLPTSAGSGWDPASSLTDLMDTARDDGEITARALDVDSSEVLSAALSGKLPGVGGGGFSVDAGSSSHEVSDAWYLGSNGWNTWEACRG